jgi:F-type H+-transporting ATPase subunit b
MQIVSNIALISINETLIVQIISFLIFLFIINRIMFQPLLKTRGDRDQYLNQIAQDIVQAKEDVEQYTSEIEERRHTIRSEAFEINKELEAVGNQEATDIVDAAVKEVSEIREDTTQKLEAQIVEARKQVLKESEPLAIQIMEKILDRRISHETH